MYSYSVGFEYRHFPCEPDAAMFVSWCSACYAANADVAANYREMLLITLYLVTIHSIYCSMVISSGGGTTYSGRDEREGGWERSGAVEGCQKEVGGGRGRCGGGGGFVGVFEQVLVINHCYF